MKALINSILKEEIEKHILLNMAGDRVFFSAVIGDKIYPEKRIKWPNRSMMIPVAPMALTKDNLEIEPEQGKIKRGDRQRYESEVIFASTSFWDGEEPHKLRKRILDSWFYDDKVDGFLMLIGDKTVWVSKEDVGFIKGLMAEKYEEVDRLRGVEHEENA